MSFLFFLRRRVMWDCWRIVNGFNLMAEYDARTINVGGEYSLPLSYKKNGEEALSLHAIAELNDGKYMSGGIQLKIHLK